MIENKEKRKKLRRDMKMKLKKDAWHD